MNYLDFATQAVMHTHLDILLRARCLSADIFFLLDMTVMKFKVCLMDMVQ